MVFAYATVLVFILVAVAFVLGSLVAGRLVRPNPKPETQGAKLATYESGEEPWMSAWFNFNPRFYLVALVFLVFDVEIALVYPVVVVFKRWVVQGHAAQAAIEIFGFASVLLFGLLYAWKKLDLEWVTSVRSEGAAEPRGQALAVARSRAGELTHESKEAHS
jgi:NADH-quinone oxidoreductase subunit A